MENLFFDYKDLKHLGKNSIIGKTVRIRKPHLVSIGDNVIIDDFTYIPCELTIGNYTHIGANCSFIGGIGSIEIGSFVNIAPSCQIVTATNDYKGGGLVGPTIPPEFADEAIVEKVTINDFALFGCNTTILPGAVVPEGMSVGAFSLVRKAEYQPWSLYVGIPARYHSKRDGTQMMRKANELLGKEVYSI